MIMLPTARNSDCQFCSVASQKSDVPRYPAQETVVSLCWICSALYTLQPVTDCPNNEAIQIAPMTSSSELESSHSRTPFAFAHFGEFCWAWGPSICSSSDPEPAWSTCLDSVDPFCTSHTLAITNTTNCRYSDCQFSITACPNEEDVTERQRLSVSGCWCSSLAWAVSSSL